MEIRDWLLVVSMVVHFVYTVWAYIERRNDKTVEKIQGLTDEVDGMKHDIVAMKHTVDGAPGHASISRVYDTMRESNKVFQDSISQLAATVNQLIGENRGQSDMLRSIFNHLAKKGMS